MIANIEKIWFDYLVSGEKEYEARVNKGKWNNVDVGDKITFYSNDKSADFIIEYISHYDNFRDVYLDFGKKLIPSGDTDEIYNKYYKQEDIEKYGIVIIKLKKIIKDIKCLKDFPVKL